MLRVTRFHLADAAGAGILTNEQADRLWSFLASRAGDISWQNFRDSWLFPFALTAIGLGIVYAGVWRSRHERDVSARLQSVLPATDRDLIVSRRFAERA